MGSPRSAARGWCGKASASSAAWDQAATIIETYRRTWHITDPALPLGTPPPEDAHAAAQRVHRHRVIAQVNDLLNEPSTADPTRTRGLDLAP